MTESPAADPSSRSEQANSVTNVSGGVSLDAGRVGIGGDVIGRDRVETAGGHIVHAAAGATVFIGAPTEAIGTGLFALHELLQRSADVRGDVFAFRTDFRAAHEQIDLLSDYKDLHDLLHQLQFHCYSDIQQSAASFPADDTTVDKFTEYAVTLDSIVEQLQQVLARGKLPEQETSWIDDVVAARADLNAALDGLDEKPLRRMISRLKRLLNTEPALINTSLYQTARVLRLHALVEALARICAGLASLHLDDGKVQVFETGIEGLRQLDQGFTALVDDHNRWQKIDLDLRLIGVTLDRDFSDLEDSWPDVKTHAEPLFVNVADEWAQALQKAGRALDEALAAGDPGRVKRGFRNFQRRVSERFFQVDVNLKSVCGDLRQIGMPLDSVLGMME